MKKFALFSIVALGQLGASNVQAACFTVYDAQHKVVYQNTESPVDMSLPIGEAVQRTHGQGAALIFSPSSEHCHPVVDVPQEPSPKVRPADTSSQLQGRWVPPEAAAPAAPAVSAASRTEEGGNANVSERAAAGTRASASGFSFGGGKTSRRRR